MRQPLVSVVIPSYNHASFVEATMESVLAQTLREVELIVIDDGSRDDSVARLRRKVEAVGDESRARLAVRANRGLCRTLNEGLLAARGLYFAYLGSDDLWEPQKLEKQVAAMEAEGRNVGAAYSDCYIIDQEDNRVDRFGRQYGFRGGDIFRDLVRFEFQPASPTNLFVRQKLINVGGFNESVSVEDYEVWLRLARYYRVAYVPEPLASFRFHFNNTSAVFPERMTDSSFPALELAFKTDPSLVRLRRLALGRQHAGIATVYYNALDLRRARREAWRALSIYPFERRAWRLALRSMLGASVVERLRGRRRTRLDAQGNHT